jgi:ABC-type multidrug transport system fused ATPase/permease subunit
MKMVVKKLNGLLTNRQKRKLLRIFLLVILSGVMETGAIACIYSFISLLTNIDGLSHHVIYRFLSEKMGGIQPDTFIIQMAFTISAMCLLKAIVLWITNYTNYVFSNTFFYEMSKGIYESYLYNDYAKITRSNSADIVKCLTNDTLQVYELIKDFMLMLMEIFTLVFVRHRCSWVCLAF